MCSIYKVPQNLCYSLKSGVFTETIDVSAQSDCRGVTKRLNIWDSSAIET